MPELLNTKVEEHIAIVKLNNPPLNLLALQLVNEMTAEFSRLSDDELVRVIILTGAGERAFCAGGDLRFAATATPESLEIAVKACRAMFNTIHDCAIPVIAAINGYALGAGLALAASCDILMASKQAVFGLPEVNTGIWPMFKYLARLVPELKMRRMVYSGQRLTAQEMQLFGSIECVVNQEELMPTAMQLAREIAEKSSFIVRLYKKAFNSTEYLGVQESLSVELEYIHQLLELHDAQKIRQSFLDKGA
jgi:enoyl-CoA hydratase/carnithine racemase